MIYGPKGPTRPNPKRPTKRDHRTQNVRPFRTHQKDSKDPLLGPKRPKLTIDGPNRTTQIAPKDPLKDPTSSKMWTHQRPKRPNRRTQTGPKRPKRTHFEDPKVQKRTQKDPTWTRNQRPKPKKDPGPDPNLTLVGNDPVPRTYVTCPVNSGPSGSFKKKSFRVLI